MDKVDTAHWADKKDLRPPVWVGHVILETDRIRESAEFMCKVGMRQVRATPAVVVLEMRGGTHLILVAKSAVTPGDARFDLMVDDLRATHEYFSALGLSPSPIEAVPSLDHEMFRVTEPAGHRITFYSSHVSGPV